MSQRFFRLSTSCGTICGRSSHAFLFVTILHASVVSYLMTRCSYYKDNNGGRGRTTPFPNKPLIFAPVHSQLLDLDTTYYFLIKFPSSANARPLLHPLLTSVFTIPNSPPRPPLPLPRTLDPTYQRSHSHSRLLAYLRSSSSNRSRPLLRNPLFI